MRGGPKQIWMDCVNREMRAIGITKYEVHDITGWNCVCRSDPITKWDQIEEEEFDGFINN